MNYSGNIWKDLQDEERERVEALFLQQAPEELLFPCECGCGREATEKELQSNFGITDYCAIHGERK